MFQNTRFSEEMTSLFKYDKPITILFLTIYSKKMKSFVNDEKDTFKQMYNMGVRASYFGQMADPETIRKSKIQISHIEEDASKEVDEKTFRLYPNFRRP